MQRSVQILLATYNGEQFLEQQLESLLQQTYTAFRVLIRDDGSTDNTLSILQQYISKYPTKFFLLQDDRKNVGATQNFGILLENADADYLFFCDQDDIWLSNKIEKSLNIICNLEAGQTSTPCLVYSDMTAVDENGNVTFESVWKQLDLHPAYFTLNRLLIQNIPHGCAITINRSMAELAKPLPKQAILHDHWLALLAVCVGKHQGIETPLVLLRNHEQNVTRQKKYSFNKLKRFFENSQSRAMYEYFIAIRVAQAEALRDRLKSISYTNPILDNFILLKDSSSWQRKQLMLKNKFFRTTFWHTFKMILRA